MARIRVVWVDFGGVLTSSVEDDLARVAARAGLSVEDLVGAMRRVAGDGRGLLEQLETGLVTEREWGRRVEEALRPKVSQVDLGEFGRHWHAGRAFNQDLYDALSALDGPKVGMLTNTIGEWERHRAGMIPDLGVFDRVIRSHEVGVRKPQPEIYALAEEAFGSDPAECLLVDDLPVNCAAARARGWTAVHHVDTASTLARLRAALG